MKGWVLVSVVFVCGLVYADGKFYVPREKVPPDMPYQRGLVLFDGKTETLLLQSKYEFEDEKGVEEFGWVVPLPSVPELASMRPRYADEIFWNLDIDSGHRVVQLRELLFAGLLIFFVLLLVLCLVSVITGFPSALRESAGEVARISALSLVLVLIISGVFLPSLLGVRVSQAGIDIIREEKIGVYDVKVIKGDDSGELVAWLNENGFKFNEEDKEVFDGYIKRGWCFVTAKVAPERLGDKKEFLGRDGLVAPLIMRFKTEEAVYPLALTATAGKDVEILLYVFSDRKMDSGGRLELRYAGKREHPLSPIMTRLERAEMRESLGLEAEEEEIHIVYPKDFFKDEEFEEGFLVKFKSVLKPEQMRKDLVFRYAKDNEPYREMIIRW